MAEAIDWILAAATLAAVGATIWPRTGRPRARMAQVMGFLLLGVVVSLIWLRLGSVDVALAEAALGGGLLGAVLVYTAMAPQPQQGLPARRRRWPAPLLGTAAGVVVTVLLSAVWLRVEQSMPGWAEPLPQRLPETGVTHEITGVLLAFRAYDTLLESAVLMLAAAAALALSSAFGGTERPGPTVTVPEGGGGAQTRVLEWMARVFSPVLLLLGLWLLFAGSSDSGGAFQSGAVLAAAAILLHAAGIRAPGLRRWLGPVLVAGVVVFTVAAFIGPILGQPWLSWEPQWAFAAILSIEVLLTAGIAAGLYAIFLALEPEEALR